MGKILRNSSLVLILFPILILSFFFYSTRDVKAEIILLQENFDDGNANDGNPVDWEESPETGSWTVINGKYRGTISPGGVSPITLTGDPSWKNYVLETTVTGVDGVDRHILFRFTQFHVRGYSIKYRDENFGVSGLIELQKHGPNVVLQRNDGFKTHVGETHRFKIEVQENHIKVFADENPNPLIDYVDNNNPILDGKIGFLIEPSGIGQPTTTFYDDLLLKTIEESPHLTVPDIKQYSSPWNDDTYDHAYLWSSDPTIERWGCALTSASMVLKYYGHSSADPDSLNEWLKLQTDGYFRNGLLNWIALSRYTKLNDSPTSPTLLYRRLLANNTNLTNELLAGRPPILKEPGHFVVAKSQLPETFGINDPAYSDRTTLAYYGNSFSAIGSYQPSHTDLSYILMTIDPNMILKVFDTSGNEIPDSYFIDEGLTDDFDGSDISGEPLGIFLFPKPTEGNYSVKIAGPSDSYNLDSYLYGKDGNVTKSVINGLISEGQNDTFTISISEKNEIKQDVSIDSILLDLDNAWNLGLIKNHRFYRSLKFQFSTAKKFLIIRRKKLAKEILQVSLHEIQTTTPYLIDTLASRIFISNIRALIGSL